MGHGIERWEISVKKIGKAQIFVWILALVPLVLAAAVYSRLPARIPMSWDFGGEVGYEPKWHLWLVAGLSPLLAALFYGMPALDPKRRNYKEVFRVLYRLPAHDDAVPDYHERHLCG